MDKILPVSVIQKTIRDQLEASREIFAVISALGDLSEDVENERQKQALVTAMQKLLGIGEKLSEAADKTGKQLLETGEGRL